jgi:hypothetical protein
MGSYLRRVPVRRLLTHYLGNVLMHMSIDPETGTGTGHIWRELPSLGNVTDET